MLQNFFDLCNNYKCCHFINSETKKTASDEKESPKITATASNSTTANTTETKGPLETAPSKSSPDKSSKRLFL